MSIVHATIPTDTDELLTAAQAALATDSGRRLAAYWFSLPRDGGLLPPRAAFNPAAIKDLLPMVLVRDVNPDGTSTMRLLGTGITDLFGKDFTGQPGISVMPAHEHERYRQVSRIMFETPCGVHVRLTMVTTHGQELPIENVSFPFAPSADGQRRTLGLFAVLEHECDYVDGGAQITFAGKLHFIDVGAGAPEPI
jgi:hypothetical protein